MSSGAPSSAVSSSPDVTCLPAQVKDAAHSPQQGHSDAAPQHTLKSPHQTHYWFHHLHELGCALQDCAGTSDVRGCSSCCLVSLRCQCSNGPAARWQPSNAYMPPTMQCDRAYGSLDAIDQSTVLSRNVHKCGLVRLYPGCKLVQGRTPHHLHLQNVTWRQVQLNNRGSKATGVLRVDKPV